MITSFHYIVFIRIIDYKTIFPKLNRFSHGKMMWVGVFDPNHGLSKIQMALSTLACAQIPTLQKKKFERGVCDLPLCSIPRDFSWNVWKMIRLVINPQSLHY